MPKTTQDFWLLFYFQQAYDQDAYNIFTYIICIAVKQRQFKSRPKAASKQSCFGFISSPIQFHRITVGLKLSFTETW